jgi:hypothetical protein
MKKTMIALAAVAAMGSASAQVALTGEFAWGYLASSTNGVETSGGGIDTSQLAFTANEDLGGGMAVKAKIVFNIGEYGAGNANADDQSLTLTTPMGALSLLTYKPGNWVTGASGGGTWYGLDGKALAARAKRDGYAFTAPLMAGLTATVAFTEPAGATGEGAGNAGQAGQGIYNVSAKYATGPVVLQAAYLSLSNPGTADSTKDSLVRLGGTYDLGVAKVGAAYEGAKLSGGGTNVETAYSLTAPLAANLSVAGTYASTNLTSSAAAYAGVVGTRNGYSVQAQYNLSKTAYVIGSYGAWTGTTTANASDFALSAKTGAIAQTATAAVATTDKKDSTFMAVTLVKDF